MQRDPFRFNGTVIDGQFRIDQWIGEGGFSNVYRGFHLGLNEPIAVKCLKPITDSPEVVQDFVNRFRDESRIAYRLSQGNLDIVRCIASGTTVAPIGVRVPYMVLEWLEGESLATNFRLRREAKKTGRSLKETFELFQPAGDAIVYAHSHGIVHRDIKPGNLFLAKTRQGGVRLKVLDFGMAKVLGDGSSESTGFSRLAMSMANIAIFSPPYAAPEQFDPTLGPIGPRVDVYSFALVFLEALMDRRVRNGETDAEMLIQACKPAAPISPRGLGLQVPDAVERIFMQACATNPRDRFQSMEEFWGKLKAAMLGDSHADTDWSDHADSIPPSIDAPATIVADTEGLFEDEPPPPMPAVPRHPQPHMRGQVAVPNSDEESTRTIDVNQLPSPPGQPPQPPIPPEVKDFLHKTGLAASARMPPQGNASPRGGFHLPRPTVPRPDDGGPLGGRLPAPLPAAGTPPEGVGARSDGANGRGVPRPSVGTQAMAIPVPAVQDDGPPSDLLPTAVGSIADLPPPVVPQDFGRPSGGGPQDFGRPKHGGTAQLSAMNPGAMNPGAGAAKPAPQRFDIASAETQFNMDAPLPFATSPQPFFPPGAGGPGAGGQGAAAVAAKGGQTMALSLDDLAHQFSAAPPVDPDAEAPTQAGFAPPQAQDASPFPQPPFGQPQPPPGNFASPFSPQGQTGAQPQQQGAPFGYGTPPGAQPQYNAGQYGAPPATGGWPQQQGQPGQPAFPPVAPTAQPQPAAKRRNFLLLVGLVTALGVVILIVGGYGAYTMLHGSGDQAAKDPGATPATTTTQSAAPVPTPAPTPPPPPPEPQSAAPPPVQPPPSAAQPTPPASAQQAAVEPPSHHAASSDRGASAANDHPSNSGGKPSGGGGSSAGPTQLPPRGGSSSGSSDPTKFNADAARQSLRMMEGMLASCKKPDGPTGTGHARITFMNDGSVLSSVITGPPYEGTPTGECAATRFKYAKAPKFEGNPGVIDYTFNINK